MASNIVSKNAALTNQLDAGRAIARSQVKLGRGIGLLSFRATKKPMASIKMQLGDEKNSINPGGHLEELEVAQRDFVAGETPLYYAESLTKHYKDKKGKGPEIYIKREDLNPCGAHMMNNAIAQVMIAKRMGRRRVVAATGGGQHGVATAAACVKHKLECTIFMGSEDIKKQSSNVKLMEKLGAKISLVEGNFREALLEVIKVYADNRETIYYLAGTVVGPHPCPEMVRGFQSVIGKETRRQAMEKWGGKPNMIVACIGSGSNALGLFNEFKEEDVRLIGVEAAGIGSERHDDVNHGNLSDILKHAEGSIFNRPSISAALEDLDDLKVLIDLKHLNETHRVEFHTVQDEEAMEAHKRVYELEGINPPFEAAHAFAYLDKLCPTLSDGWKVVVNCSGRGD
ncbi:Tryptophan synthase beta chain 1, partial [Cucurbita argyrosperma subsp. sororia]